MAMLAMIALTANLFGQLFVEERLICMRHFEDSSYMETDVSDNTGVEIPIVTPIENGYIETKLYTEPWMTVPFERATVEENLQVESWMAVPFEMDEKMGVESWMTANWI